jgi:hypothetical protein
LLLYVIYRVITVNGGYDIVNDQADNGDACQVQNALLC